VVKPQYFPCETGDDRAARSSVGLEPTDLADSRIPYNKKRAEDYPPPKKELMYEKRKNIIIYGSTNAAITFVLPKLTT